MSNKLNEHMQKTEFVAYLRKRGISFGEFYILVRAFFNLTSSERFDLIKDTGMYKNLVNNFKEK